MKLGIILFGLLMSILAYAETKYVIVTEEYEPYEYLSGGKPVGHDVEILDEIAKRKGFKLEYVYLPWKRALEKTKEGSADAIISLFDSAERREFLKFSEIPLSSEKNVIISLAETKEVKSLKDLEGQTVGLQSGYEYPEVFMKTSNFQRDEANDLLTILKKLQGGRFPYAIVNEICALTTAKKSLPELVGKYRTNFVVGDDPMYKGFAKKSPNFAIFSDLINKGLEELKKDGTLEKINKKYN